MAGRQSGRPGAPGRMPQAPSSWASRYLPGSVPRLTSSYPVAGSPRDDAETDAAEQQPPPGQASAGPGRVMARFRLGLLPDWPLPFGLPPDGLPPDWLPPDGR